MTRYAKTRRRAPVPRYRMRERETGGGLSQGRSGAEGRRTLDLLKCLVGKPVVTGTRIAVELVIDLLARGYTKEQILAQYDHLTNDDVQACLAYAAEILQSEKVYALPS